MGKIDKDILTTADTAKLLGVSVRTAQLLIEGGSLRSWKTPGGHRRVYRADVMALVEGETPAAALPSATIVILAAGPRFSEYKRIFANMAECAAEIYDNVHAALFAIGSAQPYAVVVDLETADAGRIELLQSLAANAALGHSRILAVAAPGPVERLGLADRVLRVSSPEEAALTIRGWLVDTDDSVPAASGLPFPIALNESQRLVALERTGLLDTVPEEAFDRLTWLAAHSLNAPVALMTLLTPTRQWFKSRFGLDLLETPRSWAFCNHTILQKQVFAVEDLACDPRFVDNPAVAGEPRFRFYAGAPVLDARGFVVGSLCVIDHKPRTLDERETQTLLALAALASDEVRLRALDRQVRDQAKRSDQDGRRSRGKARGQSATS